MAYSNLGGMGPDFDADKAILLKGVTTAPDGTTLDMRITNRTEYTPYEADRNALVGEFFQVNVPSGKTVELLLERGANKDLRDKGCPEDEHGLDYWVNAAVRKEELVALLARY